MKTDMHTVLRHRRRIRRIRKILPRAAAVLLTVTCFSQPLCVRADEPLYKDILHADVDFAELRYAGIDRTQFDALLEELAEICAGGTQQEPGVDGTQQKPAADEAQQARVAELCADILAETDAAYTQTVLSGLQYYCHISDAQWEQQQQEDYVLYQEMANDACVALWEAAESEYGGALREMLDEYQLKTLEDYIPMTDKAASLFDEENELIQEYYHIMAGDAWEDDYAWEGDDADLRELKELNSRAAEVLSELTAVRQETAEEYGYDSFPLYAREVLYGRDYTEEETAAFREAVKTHIVPLFLAVNATHVDETFLLNEEQEDEDVMLEAIGSRLGNVDPRLLEAWDYFTAHHCLCAGSDEDMVDMGFTDILPEFGSAYIYLKRDGTILDYESLVHEFGHFNALWHSGDHAVFLANNIDVAEIQSQGLEMLFLDSMEDIFPASRDALHLYIVDEMLYNILSGCLYDEFQEMLFEEPDMTAEEMNRCIADLEQQYGILSEEESEESLDWIQVAHTFDAPFYYFSYAASAVAALEIWAEASRNREAATERYMQITAIPETVPFKEALAEAGLPDVLLPEQVESLAGTLYGILQDELQYAPEDFAEP